MKYLATLLLIFGFGLSGFGQTIKSLGYNSTNGRVVANVNGLSLQFTNSTVEFQTLAPNNIQFSTSAEAIIYYDGNDYLQFGNNVVTFWRPLTFDNTTNAAATRTNLGLGGGITTNRTFVSYNGTNYTTNTVTISNGIVTGWTQ